MICDRRHRDAERKVRRPVEDDVDGTRVTEERAGNYSVGIIGGHGLVVLGTNGVQIAVVMEGGRFDQPGCGNAAFRYPRATSNVFGTGIGVVVLVLEVTER